MNVILKSFDNDRNKRIIERAFAGIKLGTVIHTANHKEQWPDLDAEEQIWVNAKDLREGRYPGVDWNEVTPLDEALIESMRVCEGTFMTMVDRYARYRDIPYEERRRQYMEHLRYWNHMLDAKKITLFLSFQVPHQCYDYVIYELCRHKNIAVRYLDRYFLMDAFHIQEHYEESGNELIEPFRRLKEQYADPALPVPLTPAMEAYFREQTEKNENPWYMDLMVRDARLKRRNFFLKWSGVAARFLFKRSRKFFTSVASPAFWSRKLRQHRTTQFYDRHIRQVDLDKPYVYMPLHYQPESTTCPMGGVFTDQELLAQMVAAHLPPGVSIYVKEHPAQGELCRSEEFYRSLLRIPQVAFVPRSLSTFTLAEKSVAVVTVTGTAAFEALFRGRPALMFGHRFFQFAPGVFRIRTSEECKRAIEAVLSGNQGPSTRDMRIFLKAIEEATSPYLGGPPFTQDPEIKDRKALIMGERIAEMLAALPVR